MNCSKAQRVKDAGGHIRLAGGKRAGSTDGAHGAGISERPVNASGASGDVV